MKVIKMLTDAGDQVELSLAEDVTVELRLNPVATNPAKLTMDEIDVMIEMLSHIQTAADHAAKMAMFSEYLEPDDDMDPIDDDERPT